MNEKREVILPSDFQERKERSSVSDQLISGAFVY